MSNTTRARDAILVSALSNGYQATVNVPDSDGEVEIILTDQADANAEPIYISLEADDHTGHLSLLEATHGRDFTTKQTTLISWIGDQTDPASLRELLNNGMVTTHEGPLGSTIYKGIYAHAHCAGCAHLILAGKEGLTTVTSRGHVRTITTHQAAECRTKGENKTRADRDWVRGNKGRDF